MKGWAEGEGKIKFQYQNAYMWPHGPKFREKIMQCTVYHCLMFAVT